ncbi:MAG: hypothetical protein DSZ02_07310 [Gammaproteobacteria bacterium]|nr:MAG: hypothetical protein DSZ02_07310 [Gammaproteobacteria bacterium]
MHPSRQHRHFLHISGTPEECRMEAARHADETTLWIGWQAPAPFDPLPPGKLVGRLGMETDILVFDALEGFDPDAFAMALGLVRGGGRFLLLTPPLSRWPQVRDRELERLVPAEWPVTSPSGFLERFAAILDNWERETGTPHSPARTGETGLTEDQERSKELIRHVAQGHTRRPLVITADRGRGKSTILGISAAWLLQQRHCRILVTAPRREATDILFQQARKALPVAPATGDGVQYGNSFLTFMAPDALLREAPEADLLLVDEAAGIPLPLLEGLIRKYGRIVLTSTVHGYEGSGRGFLLRLGPLLDRIRPQWKGIRLEQPVRWAAGDPLEAFGFRTLLLDAEPAPLEGETPEAGDCVARPLSREELLADESLLKQLFGLLVSAHYRTTPRDLRYLLDAPNLSLHGLFQREKLLGAVLVAREGNLSRELASAVRTSQRRPKGYLLPQLLATRCQFPEALEMRCERVVRIAIHPRLQNRGLGSHLLRYLVNRARRDGEALLGTSFGATPPLVHFWKAAGFEALRLGQRREASSGAHAALMVLGLEPEATKLVEAAAQRFQKNFPLQLGEAFTGLDAELALALRPPQQEIRLDDSEAAALQAFAQGRLPYLDAMAALRSLTLQLGDGQDTAQRLLVMKVLQHRSLQELARLQELPGKAAVEARLRQAVLDLTQSPLRRP